MAFRPRLFSTPWTKQAAAAAPRTFFTPSQPHLFPRSTLHNPRTLFTPSHPHRAGFPRSGNRYTYTRFSSPRASGLLSRWAARPTFYYEVSFLAGTCGVFYIANLEEVPVSHRRRFNIVSARYERESGAQLYRQVMAEYGARVLPASHAESRMVRRVLARLLPHSGLVPGGGAEGQGEGDEWEVHVIRDPQKNAFVIPGGKVFVFEGILEVCAGEDGLAAVLGHEIAHCVARHSAERMSSVAVLLPVALVVAVATGLGDIGNVFTRMAVDLAFLRPGSRRQESEADYIGLMMMASACYDPSAAARLWARMEKEEEAASSGGAGGGGGPPPQFLSTHPSSHNRQGKIREWLPEAESKREEAGCGGTAAFANDFKSAFGYRF